MYKSKEHLQLSWIFVKLIVIIIRKKKVINIETYCIFFQNKFTFSCFLSFFKRY